MPAIYEEIISIRARGEKAALAIVVGKDGSAPRRVGTKMIVSDGGQIVGTLGGGALEEEVIARALAVIKQGTPRTFTFSLSGREGKKLNMICGGTVSVYIEPIEAEDNLYLVGGGHIARALCRMAKMGEWRVTVIDDNPRHASKENFPDADAIVVKEFRKAVKELSKKPNEYFVVATRSHREDKRVLPLCLERSPRYVGMIGSRSKIREIGGDLKKKGIPPSKFRSLHAPMGLDLGGGDPWEIALAVMAEILSVKYRRSGRALNRGSGKRKREE